MKNTTFFCLSLVTLSFYTLFGQTQFEWGIPSATDKFSRLYVNGNSIFVMTEVNGYPGLGSNFTAFYRFDENVNMLDSTNSLEQFGFPKVHYRTTSILGNKVFVGGDENQNLMAAVLDQSGNLEHSWMPSEPGGISDIVSFSNGNLLLSGASYLNINTNSIAELVLWVKNDTLGEISREVIGTGGYFRLFKISESAVFAVADFYNDTVNFPNQITRQVVLKLNSNGQIVDSIEIPRGFTETFLNGYNGYIKSVDFSHSQNKLFLQFKNRIFVYDTNLILLNTFIQGDYSPFHISWGDKMRVDQRGNIFVGGRISGSGLGYMPFALFKFDNNGNLTFIKPVLELPGLNINGIAHVGDKILIGGYRNDTNVPIHTQNFLAILDTLGNLCHSPCVWPGDVNHDGVVNHSDALYLALAQGDSGTIRYNATLQWRQQDSRDWTASFANGANVKHADTDGDGHITLSDTLAIAQNYMQTHQKSAAVSSSGIPVWLSLDATGPAVNLHVGESQNLPLYGIAYTITLSGPAAFSGQPAMHQSGWLTTGAGQALALHKFFDNHQTLEAALARTNRTDATSSGHIATIPLNLLPGSGPVLATLEFVQLVTADGAFHPAALRGDTALLSSLPPVAGEEARLEVFPIPAGDELRLSLAGTGEQLKTINLFSLDGRLLLSQQIETPQTNIVLALPPAATGTLLLEATTTTRTIYRKKVVRLR